MSRYIDANLIGDRVSKGLVDYEVIKKIPTADVVEVVRCDNCKWNYIHVTPKGKDYHICKLLNLAFDNDDKFYCSYGERMDLQ